MDEAEPVVRSGALGADLGIRHAFFTRRGGVSEGLFGSLNCAAEGAAHGGWRGALGGVVEATLARMAELGATRRRIRAAIGPCIAQRSYEVGPEFPQPFVAEDPGNIRFFAPAPSLGRFLFDLGGYIAHRLARAGIAAVEVAPHDTVAEGERFFSYRRARLRGERSYGRGLSAIVLEE